MAEGSVGFRVALGLVAGAGLGTLYKLVLEGFAGVYRQR